MISLIGIDLLSLQSGLQLSKDEKGAALVYDPIRRKHVRSTPEEIVRQLWAIYFSQSLGLNPKLIAVERSFQVNGMKRRFDMVLFKDATHPLMLIEFKSPEIAINQSTFDQIARYNMELHVPYALISNGTRHICFQIDDEKKEFVYLDKLPF